MWGNKMSTALAHWLGLDECRDETELVVERLRLEQNIETVERTAEEIKRTSAEYQRTAATLREQMIRLFEDVEQSLGRRSRRRR